MPLTPPLFRLGAIILAAGASSRMGRPKMLLPWQGTTVIGHLINQWRQVGAGQLGVVCNPSHDALLAELDRIGFPAADRIFNPTPELGMFGSVKCAARWGGWNPAISHWAIALGDQPHLPLSSLQALLEFSRTHPEQVCQPSRLGKPRHPLFLPRAIFEEIPRSPAAHLKEFLQGQPAPGALCEMNDPLFDLDLDTPEDYARVAARAENA